MKKIFFAVVVVIAMVSCSQEEVLEVNREQIAFGEAFVENSTRAAIDGTYKTGKDIQSFKVWGTVRAIASSTEVVIFDGTPVRRPDDLTGYNPATAWICDTVQYWVPNAVYNFTAVVDGDITEETIAEDKIKLIRWTLDSQKDLLLATTEVSVMDDGYPMGTNDKGLVAFTFNHLLSKAYFTFKTKKAFATDAYTYEISDIKFETAYQGGAYSLKHGYWIGIDGFTTAGELSFGDTVTLAPSMTAAVEATSQYARVFIPQANILVSFKVTIKLQGTKISSKDYKYTIFEGPSDENRTKPGHQYNFVVEIAENNTIHFTVNSDPVWTDGVGNTPIEM